MSPARNLKIYVESMSCASCVGRLETAVGKLAGVTQIAANLADRSINVALTPPATGKAVVAALTTAGYPARTRTIVLQLSSLSCASCVGRVDRALADVSGVLEVIVNLAAENATVTYLEGSIAPADLVAASRKAGYPAELGDPDKVQSYTGAKDEEIAILARKTILAAVLAAPVFILAMGSHAIPAFHDIIMQTIGHQVSWIIQFLLTAGVLLGPGRAFFAKGIPALLGGAPDMNSLVALGTSAAFGYSTVATFLPDLLPAGTAAVYFEAAAVIIVLILLGRYMEARAKGRTGVAIQKLLKLRAKTALVMRGDTQTEIAIENIAVGDILIVRPGERLAVDGTVTKGESYIDESMISGEPIPITKQIGDPVTGGTLNGAGGLHYCATHVGADTTLAQIIQMVRQAQGAKLPIQGLVDRVTLWFVPAVLVGAFATVMIWMFIGPTPALSHALVAGVSVLIIACPCAMGLATPTSIMVGTGRAAELGVLFRKSDALQMLSDIDVVAFDKTGTLTQGRPKMTDLIPMSGGNRGETLRLMAALEVQSEHPIGRAIVQAASNEGIDLPEVTGFVSHTGYGVAGRVEGRDILVGADRLMMREGIDIDKACATEAELASLGRTSLYVSIDGQLAAVVAVADTLKDTTIAAVSMLKAQGIKVAMITGDKQETADVIGRQAGIENVIAGVLPDGKIAALDQLRGQGQRVAFVGDGINDAPALAHADVGIAIGTGTDIAIESADVVLMSGDLGGVVNAFEISRRTMRNIRQNLFWAFGYNAAIIPVAAGVLYPVIGVLLSPMLAAGAMAMSSVFVLSNALRLRFVSPIMNARTEPVTANAPALLSPAQ